MKPFRILFMFLIAVSVSALAQPQEELPHSLIALRQGASSKTEFTLDHSMLVFASKLDSDNDDLRRVIAGISTLSVHNFRFSGNWAYDPAAEDSITQQYKAAGWKRVVNNHRRDNPGETEMWVRLQNNVVSNVAILAAGARGVTFIAVSGSISPMDLFHLSGHFGIPKIEGGVTVPNPQ